MTDDEESSDRTSEEDDHTDQDDFAQEKYMLKRDGPESFSWSPRTKKPRTDASDEEDSERTSMESSELGW